jgi:hypothetical protein
VLPTLTEAWQQAAAERVGIACADGRARTGTALACLAILDGVLSAEAVTFVREHYRPHAVETPGQRRYVARWPGSDDEPRHVGTSLAWSLARLDLVDEYPRPSSPTWPASDGLCSPTWPTRVPSNRCRAWPSRTESSPKSTGGGTEFNECGAATESGKDCAATGDLQKVLNNHLSWP